MARYLQLSRSSDEGGAFRMYVCTCNGVSERKVEAAIEAGARSPRAVHHACGTKPQCGRCLPEIAARLRAAKAKDNALTSTFERDELAASA